MLNWLWPIKIYPARITLNAQNQGQPPSFIIRNRTPATWHEVYLRLGITGSEIQAQDIRVFPEIGSDRTPLSAEDSFAYLDVMELKCSDKSGKEYIHLILRRLHPHAIQVFRVESKKIANSDFLKANISITLIKYSRQSRTLNK